MSCSGSSKGLSGEETLSSPEAEQSVPPGVTKQKSSSVEEALTQRWGSMPCVSGIPVPSPLGLRLVSNLGLSSSQSILISESLSFINRTVAPYSLHKKHFAP